MVAWDLAEVQARFRLPHFAPNSLPSTSRLSGGRVSLAVSTGTATFLALMI